MTWTFYLFAKNLRFTKRFHLRKRLEAFCVHPLIVSCWSLSSHKESPKSTPSRPSLGGGNGEMGNLQVDVLDKYTTIVNIYIYVIYMMLLNIVLYIVLCRYIDIIIWYIYIHIHMVYIWGGVLLLLLKQLGALRKRSRGNHRCAWQHKLHNLKPTVNRNDDWLGLGP